VNKLIRKALFLATLAALLAPTRTAPFAVNAEHLTPAFRVDSVSYEIDGRTREWALQEVLDIEEGMTFLSEVEMEAFFLRQQQILLNQRVLQEGAVEYRIIGPGDDTDEEGPVNVAVTVSARDTWNFIVLPYFKYDSNSGLLLSLRTRDYNFFGTMQRLAIDFDYERTEDNDNLYTIASEFRLPFNLLDRRWEFIFQQGFETDGRDFDFDISTGLGYYFTWLGLDWRAVYTESYRYLTDDDENDNYYFTSDFELGSTIDTGLDLFWYGPLEYRPGTYVEWNYRPGGISEERSGVTVGFEHYLDAGDYDWIGNYRHGQTFEIGNDNGYNIIREKWDRDITFQSAVYRPLFQKSPTEWPKGGVSAGTSGFYLIDGASDDQDDAAKAARGILDDTMNGDLGLFLNLDAVVTVWTLPPIFEAQFGAFFDVAWVRDLRGDFYDETSFKFNRDLRYGAGIEVVGFPLFARSLYIRGSLGTDLLAVKEGTNPLSSEIREIFIGLGHHY
jgi:hypothetical protein